MPRFYIQTNNFVLLTSYFDLMIAYFIKINYLGFKIFFNNSEFLFIAIFIGIIFVDKDVIQKYGQLLI